MNLVRFNHPGFSHFFENFEKTHNGVCNETKGNMPSVNTIENDKDFILEIAAPGLKKDEFKINLENQTLTVSREVKEEKKEKKENYTRREFVYGNFSRSFTLPKSIMFDKIAADYNDGILKLTLPKKEKEAKLSREINIS
ncbi:MAG TPA: Hsp20/alpha crystallin family protein [Bacteroidales bacterium]|jgi:HSP20 family protein|nr:Hsp20/alpha crystallin family protein [Bacteroidales bacterium]|tara:strand:+ start:789 stop:1208 length:420 start_codon:yes stop_codon:yes gene_type:complete